MFGIIYTVIKKIKNHILLIVLILITLFVCFKNYTPGTILSGWDTLHPEFNFRLNISREVGGVFRENQGLGAVAAHADMADLPHILILYIFHFLIDRDFLRYFYIFSNLILGAVGMYFFLYKVVLKDKTVSFLGALFYILNLGTMQQFVVPFEMFTTQYATLPWLFLLASTYIYAKRHSRKSLLLFSILTIFSSPMAFAPTLWYIYLFVFASYVLLLTVPQFLKKNSLFLKRAFSLILLTIILNLYWILPNIYYIVSHGSEVQEASINKIFSPQAFLYNKEFGNIFDIALLKSFLFDWSVYTDTNNFQQLLSPWIEHLNNPLVLGVGFIFAFIAIAGIIKGVFIENKFLISFIPALILSLLFLFNDNFPFSGIYNFLKDNVPFFKEAYRFPANKVFVIFTFIYCLFFSFGLAIIKSYLKRFSLIYSSIFAVLIIFYMAPSFRGNFISPYMRVKIPEMYFEMFDWFRTKPKDARIANFPIHSIFGWEYYDWSGLNPAKQDEGARLRVKRDRRGHEVLTSFQGAGFAWFGIEQPLLNRDFDRWSTYNERYYKEMSYAIYSQNPSFLKATLEKYNIKYILLDKSIIVPQNNPKILFYKETQNLLENQPYIQKVKDFNNTLIIYEVDLSNDLAKNNSIYSFYDLTDNQGKILPNLLNDIPQIPVIEKKSKDIYPKKPQKEIPINIFSLKYFLNLCDNVDSNATFGINKEKKANSFSLFALKNQVCMTIPLKSIFREKNLQFSLLELSLNYKTQAPIGFCLSNLAEDMCVNYGSKNVLTGQLDPGNLLKYFNLDDNAIENLGITFYLDATNSNFEERAVFENLFVSLISPQDITSTRPISETPQLAYSKIKIAKPNQNCEDNSFINPFLENQTLESVESHFIEYVSVDGVSCDRFFFDMPQNQAYLVLITSKNTSGLPLYLCVENKISKHCDIYANLSTSSNFVREAFLLPPQIKNARGYDVIINSIGIKKSLSINSLKSIQFIPLPYDFSQVKYSSYDKKPKADLIMPQSYEKGWKAYGIQNSEFRIQNWFNNALPFIFGKEIKNHILVNGWANGWIIDGSGMKQPASPQGGFNNERIVIIFLPQYLEYLGFVAIGGILLVMVFSYLRKPTE